MDDLDTLLSRIKDLPVDSRLDGIDDAVFTGLAARRARSQPTVSAMALVAVLSLGGGVMGSAIMPARTAETATVFPFGAPAALAPSSLLETRE